jgi:hypothetical protein
MANGRWRVMIVEVLTRDFKFSRLGVVARLKKSLFELHFSGFMP